MASRLSVLDLLCSVPDGSGPEAVVDRVAGAREHCRFTSTQLEGLRASRKAMSARQAAEALACRHLQAEEVAGFAAWADHAWPDLGRDHQVCSDGTSLGELLTTVSRRLEDAERALALAAAPPPPAPPADPALLAAGAGLGILLGTASVGLLVGASWAEDERDLLVANSAPQAEVDEAHGRLRARQALGALAALAGSGLLGGATWLYLRDGPPTPDAGLGGPPPDALVVVP